MILRFKMALVYTIDEAFPAAWPEERVLTHLLRSCAAASPEPFTSLRGNHPVDVLVNEENYELKADAPGEWRIIFQTTFFFTLWTCL